nr:uncharacterized protein LOC113717846 isoform X1 [Coffea arabica]
MEVPRGSYKTLPLNKMRRELRSAFDMSIGCQFNIMLRILENAILSFMSCNDTPSPWKTEVDDGKVTRQEPNSFADQLIRASPCQVIEQSGVFQADGLQFGDMPTIISTAVGQMAISKGRQGRGAQNLVKVYLANLRLKGVATDVLITAYEPIVINPLSESAIAVGAGVAVPAAQSGCMPMNEVFQLAATSFKVNDWSLFGAAS